MREAATQTIGQQKEMASYRTVKRTQDMATVIRQAVAASPSHISRFALITIEYHFTARHNSSLGVSVPHERNTYYYLRNATQTKTRQNDLIWLKDTTCYFLLADVGLQGGELGGELGGDLVQHRLWKALQKSIAIMQEHTTALPCATTIGYSTYPEPATTIEQCLEDALAQCEVECETLQKDDVIQMSPLPETDLATQARQLGVPYVPFLPRILPSRLKRLVKPELAQELHCFPLGYARNTLTVAMSNPQDDQILNRLQQETGMQIFPVLIDQDELQDALDYITR